MSATARNEQIRIISKDVAKILGIHQSTLLRRIKANKFIKPYKDEHGYFYWYMADIDRYIRGE